MSAEERDEERDGELERLRASLYAPDAPPAAAEAYRAAMARLAAESQDSPPPDAPVPVTEAPEEPSPAGGEAAARPSRSRRRLRTGILAAAALVAAGGAALLLAPRPAPEPVAAPLRTSPALWSGAGTTAVASPELDGRGSALFVRLSCRGEGRVLLALDGRVRSLSCTPARTIRDDQYFDGAHDEFLLSLSLVGHPFWSASVHRVLQEPGAAVAGPGGRKR